MTNTFYKNGSFVFEVTKSSKFMANDGAYADITYKGGTESINATVPCYQLFEVDDVLAKELIEVDIPKQTKMLLEMGR